ncbi:MAG: hypothetical protein U0936_15075 [Planctomycetaceae bacterium]
MSAVPATPRQRSQHLTDDSQDEPIREGDHAVKAIRTDLQVSRIAGIRKSLLSLLCDRRIDASWLRQSLISGQRLPVFLEHRRSRRIPCEQRAIRRTGQTARCGEVNTGE